MRRFLSRRRSRRGVSLVETLVVVAIGMLLLAVVYRLLMSATKTGEETTEELKLLVDLRAMIENMSRDVAAAHIILPPSGGEDFKKSLTLCRYASEDAADRPELNKDSKVYPFFDASATTVVKMNLLRVRYVLDASKRTVTRIEEKGTLDAKPTAASGASQRDMRTLSEFTFNVDGAPTSNKIVGRLIQRFDISYLMYDDKGLPRLATAAGECSKAAAIGLNVRAVMDQGLYGREAGKTATRRQPVVELATKIWSQRKLSEAVYPEYFSSADDDLRY